MLAKQCLTISTLLFLWSRYPQIANSCENKFTRVAHGNLEPQDLYQLKREYRNRAIKINTRDQLTLNDLQGILGFSGEQLKITNNGRVQHWIWIDSENCSRRIQAGFRDQELVQIKNYGF
jgi:hypothetical protein